MIPVLRERLVAVQAVGWGDGHEVLRTNQYRNPFWNTNAFFQTEKGHSVRISVYWHGAVGGTERAMFHGDRLSFLMERPEGAPTTVFHLEESGADRDSAGYPVAHVRGEVFAQPDHFEKLPAPLRVKTGHRNSHTFITHEFVRACLEDRHPEVDVWEAIAYTLPGIVAHQSALRGGELLRIPDYGAASS